MRRAKIVSAGLVLCIAVIAALAGSPAPAQVIYRPWGGWGGYGGYGYGFGGGTAAGNYMQGMSTVIRSSGEYNLLSSMAGVNNEEARSRYIDNNKKWMQNYFQMKEQRMALEAQRKEMNRRTNEALAAAAKTSGPRPLSSSALDPVTGQITWPEVLQASQFAALRTELEKLFELRAKAGATEATNLKIRSTVEDMTKLLRKQVEKTKANEYMAARKFLDGLDREARSV